MYMMSFVSVCDSLLCRTSISFQSHRKHNHLIYAEFYCALTGVCSLCSDGQMVTSTGEEVGHVSGPRCSGTDRLQRLLSWCPRRER